MKVAILAGGFGTRLAGETEARPKPMVEIGGSPILWHIMKLYSHYGFKEFFVALGYKGYVIKRYFQDYYSLNRSLTVNLANGEVKVHERQVEDWLVHLIDTGSGTQTGGRIKRLEPWLKEETFMATYGDGVSDIDLQKVLDFHRSHGLLATVTVVRPPARFGNVQMDGDRVVNFTEKPQTGEGWISGGFLVFEPGVFEYLEGDDTILEAHALERLAEVGQLAAYRHEGFWQCMDTPRDMRLLHNLWDSGKPPWKIWR